ncbi:MAG TPA: zinc ribbon domain-containing protein [Bacillota bacterium]|nr:zinc ribbon domain-containing protein [Bacillota bacterium]
MPLYEYQCRNCGHRFEAYYSLSQPEFQKSSPCPQCQNEAKRVFTPLFTPRVAAEHSDLAADPPEYQEMHYYEKKKDWLRAAEAAEGISEYAKKKFLEKAQTENS